MIVCVLLDRFELTVAAGGRAGLLGEPAALAPEPGRELFVGEVSQAAEAFGIHAGMRMGEACFDASGLQRLHSGQVVRMLAEGYLAAQGSERLRKVLSGARVGQGPTRFCAMVAAHGARVRRPQRVAGAVSYTHLTLPTICSV